MGKVRWPQKQKYFVYLWKRKVLFRNRRERTVKSPWTMWQINNKVRPCSCYLESLFLTMLSAPLKLSEGSHLGSSTHSDLLWGLNQGWQLPGSPWLRHCPLSEVAPRGLSHFQLIFFNTKKRLRGTLVLSVQSLTATETLSLNSMGVFNPLLCVSCSLLTSS